MSATGCVRGAVRTKIVAILGVLGVAAGAFFAFKQPSRPDSSPRPSPKPTAFVSLGEFLVNLADQDTVRFLKTELTVEIEGMGAKEFGRGGQSGHGRESDEDPRLARMRDISVMVLSDATFEGVRAPGGKECLKQQLKTAMNKEFADLQVVTVLFTSFVMQ